VIHNTMCTEELFDKIFFLDGGGGGVQTMLYM